MPHTAPTIGRIGHIGPLADHTPVQLPVFVSAAAISDKPRVDLAPRSK